MPRLTAAARSLQLVEYTSIILYFVLYVHVFGFELVYNVQLLYIVQAVVNVPRLEAAALRIFSTKLIENVVIPLV